MELTQLWDRRPVIIINHHHTCLASGESRVVGEQVIIVIITIMFVDYIKIVTRNFRTYVHA